MVAHDLGKHLGAANDGQAARAGGVELRIAGFDRARDHDMAGGAEVFRAVADRHRNSLRLQSRYVGAGRLVAALHGDAARVQDFRDRAHADAADADDVNRADAARKPHA